MITVREFSFRFLVVVEFILLKAAFHRCAFNDTNKIVGKFEISQVKFDHVRLKKSKEL
jgi:hypothetical protein